jgi:hypothetical protein
MNGEMSLFGQLLQALSHDGEIARILRIRVGWGKGLEIEAAFRT